MKLVLTRGLREFCNNCWWPLSYQHFLLLLLLLLTVVCTQLEKRKVDSVERNPVNLSKIFFFFLQISCSPTKFMHLLLRQCFP